MPEPFFPADNAESWRRLRAFIEEYAEYPRSLPWQELARQVTAELEGFGLAPVFRVGMSMHQVIFSTLDHHGLKDEPRVTLEFRPTQQEVRIAYSRAHLEARPPLLDVYVSAPVAVQVTLGALRRLWTETRPDVPMPEQLQGRKPPAPG